MTDQFIDGFIPQNVWDSTVAEARDQESILKDKVERFKVEVQTFHNDRKQASLIPDKDHKCMRQGTEGIGPKIEDLQQGLEWIEFKIKNLQWGLERIESRIEGLQRNIRWLLGLRGGFLLLTIFCVVRVFGKVGF